MQDFITYIIVFSIASFVNVILNTVKTIIMYKQDKLSSSLINAVCYGFYTVVVVFMAGEMALWLKIILTAITNFFGVWVSMNILERFNKKFHKDKLWIINATVRTYNIDKIDKELTEQDLSYNYSPTNRNGEYVFSIYANTQEESRKVRTIVEKYNMKYDVHESTLRL